MIRLLALVGTTALLAAGPAMAGDPVIGFDRDDPVMNTAIADARGTLPVFFDRMAAGRDRDYSLKVGVSTTTGVEHIWVGQLSVLDSDSLRGRLANTPNDFDGKVGDPIEFDTSQVSDWMIQGERGIYGGYTIRAMLPSLPEEQAEAIGAALAPMTENGGF